MGFCSKIEFLLDVKKTIYEFIKGLTQANLETRFILDIYVLKTMIYYLNLVSLRNSWAGFRFQVLGGRW